jgi:hypothetical protein
MVFLSVARLHLLIQFISIFALQKCLLSCYIIFTRSKPFKTIKMLRIAIYTLCFLLVAGSSLSCIGSKSASQKAQSEASKRYGHKNKKCGC